MTDSQITPQTPFHERIYDRIRESLGELMTAEEAQKLVERAIEEGLFKERRVPQPGYSNPDKVLPSLFVEMVTAEVQPLVKEAIREWIKANPDAVNTVIREVLQDGILAAAYRALKGELEQATWNLQGQLAQVVNKIGGM